MESAPKRVLVIDNDPDVLKSVKFNLTIDGYEVLTASTPEEARRILACEVVHLAIVDVRLRYERRADDQSGFEVARALPKDIPFIIFTAYEDRAVLKRALVELGAKESLDKKSEEDASRLVEVVDDLFAKHVKVNFNLEIEGTVSLESVAREIETPQDQAGPPTVAHVRQVLQALFHQASGVQLSPLLRPEQAPSLSQSGSVVLKARPRYNVWGAPLVVKFGAQGEIAREVANYEQIKRFLKGHRLAVLETAAYSCQIGGLVYRLIGAHEWEGIHTFEEAYHRESAETLIGLLDRFFSGAFEELFAQASHEPVELMDLYTAQLSLTPEKLRKAIGELYAGGLPEPRVQFKQVDGSFPNPVAWTLADGKFRPIEGGTGSRKCLCHGDLHSRNILVDTEGQFWLIDFARAAESHALRDFAELETDIKFNLLSETDVSLLLPLERILLAPARFGEEPPASSLGSESLDKAYRVVSALRAIAGRLLKLEGCSMREYYVALLAHTLNVIRLRSIRKAKKEHALLSAALICQRLDEGTW